MYIIYTHEYTLYVYTCVTCVCRYMYCIHIDCTIVFLSQLQSGPIHIEYR